MFTKTWDLDVPALQHHLRNDQLVLRANLARESVGDRGDRLATTIVLLTLVGRGAERYIVSLCYQWVELTYEEQFNDSTPFSFDLGPTFAINLPGQLLDKRVQAILDSWKAKWPGWLDTNTAAAATQDGKELVSPSHPFFLVHYGRLHVSLNEVWNRATINGRKQEDGENVRTFRRRLGGLIHSEIGKWSRDLGWRL